MMGRRSLRRTRSGGVPLLRTPKQSKKTTQGLKRTSTSTRVRNTPVKSFLTQTLPTNWGFPVVPVAGITQPQAQPTPLCVMADSISDEFSKDKLNIDNAVGVENAFCSIAWRGWFSQLFDVELPSGKTYDNHTHIYQWLGLHPQIENCKQIRPKYAKEENPFPFGKLNLSDAGPLLAYQKSPYYTVTWNSDQPTAVQDYINAEMECAEGEWHKVTKILEAYGHHVLHCKIDFSVKMTPINWYTHIGRWLSLMPNLAKLSLVCRIEEAHSEDLFEKWLTKNSFAEMKHLISLTIESVPILVLNHLLSKCPPNNFVKLQVIHDGVMRHLKELPGPKISNGD